MSSLSSKFSSTQSPTPTRSASVDARTTTPAGPRSPQVEFGNPFDKKQAKRPAKTPEKSEEPVVVVTHTPRRQSVLVSAGQERKLDNPGFLTNALRRLSSSSNATLGKGAGVGAAGQRRIMNVDPNRERVKIVGFDQNKLKRVAFCVDVEIAGYGAQADEEREHPTSKPPTSAAGQKIAIAQTAQPQGDKKDTSKAKYKDMGEGAALKKPHTAEEEVEKLEKTEAEAASIAQEESEKPVEKSEESAGSSLPTITTDAPLSEPQTIPTTRKKEKKKRSEAERKERRERKRRQAEANGLVPMELSGVHGDDSDSSSNPTPPGATTPRNGDSPTTDPLRIYKRCCQLRETGCMDRIKDQISKPSATLAEAPGTVAVIDLSGTQMSLEDTKTFGDWLAVVPVRKLVLDDCGLTDESLRVILAGLSGCKSMEQARQNRKLPKRLLGGNRGQEQMGVIEKLSLKNNSKITNTGWKHLALFMHISRSLKGIDLSGIPFPHRSQDYMGAQGLSRTSTASSTSTNNTATPEPKYGDIGSLIAKALSERFGDKLEEMIFSRCRLAASNIGDIVDCCIKRRIRRLGLAENDLTPEGLEHVVRYVKSGACEGLDLGGNSLHGAGPMVADAVDENNPLFAMSLSDCNLTPEDLSHLLAPLAKLKNFKFIDLSRNHKLFGGQPNAVPVLRKLLPRLKALRRIHLTDVDMSSEHVIALAEMLPDCPELAHVSILDNANLVHAINSKEGSAQEEACAFLASLMTAVRISHTIIAIELEVPSSDSSEVVKALASQIVAYSLRNMEYSALDEAGVEGEHAVPGKFQPPEVLLHLVGHMEGYNENHDNDEPAPDEDYMIASTGIVKALGVCLGTNDTHSGAQSRNITPTASGTVTPKQGSPIRLNARKPKNVSLQLCDSARKIRMRLRPAMVKEDRAGNDTQYSKFALAF
jgi:Ran GTPase-activating protein (RanGAP) involved in mRNA processing and transport